MGSQAGNDFEDLRFQKEKGEFCDGRRQCESVVNMENKMDRRLVTSSVFGLSRWLFAKFANILLTLTSRNYGNELPPMVSRSLVENFEPRSQSTNSSGAMAQGIGK